MRTRQRSGARSLSWQDLSWNEKRPPVHDPANYSAANAVSDLAGERFDAEERAAYLRRANAVRRGGAATEEDAGADSEEASGTMELGEQRYVEMSASEQFVLTIS